MKAPKPPIAEQLAAILAAENAALARTDLAAAAGYLPAKEAAIAALIAAGKGCASAATASRVRELAHENRRLLAHAIAVQAEVLAIIANAIPRETNGYGGQNRRPRFQPPHAISASV
jgi:hypothetical protein